MKFMPPKPDWMIRPQMDPDTMDHMAQQFERWYDREIKPLFDNAEEAELENNQKALLIKIEPLTAEDILRQWIKEEDLPGSKMPSPAFFKAKAFLDKK